jgi:hypothetical protein
MLEAIVRWLQEEIDAEGHIDREQLGACSTVFQAA